MVLAAAFVPGRHRAIASHNHRAGATETVHIGALDWPPRSESLLDVQFLEPVFVLFFGLQFVCCHW